MLTRKYEAVDVIEVGGGKSYLTIFGNLTMEIDSDKANKAKQTAIEKMGSGCSILYIDPVGGVLSNAEGYFASNTTSGKQDVLYIISAYRHNVIKVRDKHSVSYEGNQKYYKDTDEILALLNAIEASEDTNETEQLICVLIGKREGVLDDDLFDVVKLPGGQALLVVFGNTIAEIELEDALEMKSLLLTLASVGRDIIYIDSDGDYVPSANTFYSNCERDETLNMVIVSKRMIIRMRSSGLVSCGNDFRFYTDTRQIVNLVNALENCSRPEDIDIWIDTLIGR